MRVKERRLTMSVIIMKRLVKVLLISVLIKQIVTEKVTTTSIDPDDHTVSKICKSF